MARQTLADYDCSKDHHNVVEYQMGEVDGLPFRPCQGRVLTRALRRCAHNYGAGESWAYLGDLNPRLLSLFSSCDKDDEAVDFGHSVAPSARF